MPDPSLREAFEEAGGERRTVAVEWPITPDKVRAWCGTRERLLRAGYPRHELPAQWEKWLTVSPIDNDSTVWRRYQLLLALAERKEGFAVQQDEHRQVLARLIVGREPVPVRIAGRTVHVTGRSYASMIALFRHEQSLRLVGEVLDRFEQRTAEVRAEVEVGDRSWLSGWQERWHIWWMRRECEHQWEHHVRGILANALSESPAAARPDQAPDWWYEVGEDELKLLVGIFEAGHRRMLRMNPVSEGPPPSTEEKEDFGWDGLLRALEAKKRLPPMTLDDSDFFQLLMAEQMGARTGDQEAEAEDLFAA